MSKVILDPLVLLAVLAGLVMWGISLLAWVPGAWWTWWAVATVLVLARAILTQRRHSR